MEQLGTSQHDPNPFQQVQGQNIKETKQSVLKSMFYIGNTPFDQVINKQLQLVVVF